MAFFSNKTGQEGGKMAKSHGRTAFAIVQNVLARTRLPSSWRETDARRPTEIRYEVHYSSCSLSLTPNHECACVRALTDRASGMQSLANCTPRFVSINRARRGKGAVSRFGHGLKNGPSRGRWRPPSFGTQPILAQIEATREGKDETKQRPSRVRELISEGQARGHDHDRPWMWASTTDRGEGAMRNVVHLLKADPQRNAPLQSYKVCSWTCENSPPVERRWARRQNQGRPGVPVTGSFDAHHATLTEELSSSSGLFPDGRFYLSLY